MWQAVLKLYHSDCPIVNRAVKFGVTVYSYPSTWYSQGNKKFVTTICFFHGDEGMKEKFLADLKKDLHIKRLEVEGDVFTYEYELFEGGEHVQLYYDSRLILTKPVVNSPEKFERWSVASWDKEFISEFIKQLQEHMDLCEVEKIVEGNLKDVYFPNVLPDIPPAQKKALELAYKHGYYFYPRKISVQELAEKAGVSFSTFQENLRRAEIKLLPILIDQYIILSSEQKELVIKARIKNLLKKK